VAVALLAVAAIVAGLPALTAAQASSKADQHLKEGLTFACMKNYESARMEFTKAIEVNPKYAAAYANRGVAYMNQQKYSRALDDLKKAEELDPKDKMVRYNLAALYSLQNQRDLGLEALDKALALGFDDSDALRTDRDIDNLRRAPEFRKVLEKHKIPPEPSARGQDRGDGLLDAATIALAFGGMLGSFLRALTTKGQSTLSKQTGVDMIVGGIVGVLLPVVPLSSILTLLGVQVQLPSLPTDWTPLQKGAAMAFVAYVFSDAIRERIMNRLMPPQMNRRATDRRQVGPEAGARA
jgi:tetratricopeptide (TPR) repeat protein